MLELLSEKITRAGELYETGLSTRDIAPLLGISKSTAALWVSKAGVKIDKIARISAKAKGRISPRRGIVLSNETKAKMSASNIGRIRNVGSKRTLEQRENMSAAAKRRSLNPNDSAKRSEASKKAAIGWKMTAAEKAARDGARSACKRMLRRILTMARVRKDARTEVLLGYSKIELREHLESQFRPGMCWEQRDSFHIDHKRPVADFFRNGVFDPKQINALDNLQVLTPVENRLKSDHYITIDKRGTSAGIEGA